MLRDAHDPQAIEAAAAALAAGQLVAIPTETVYGLAADASNPQAVVRVFQAKGRPATHPLILHVADLHAARDWVSNWPREAEILAEAFWPGPLTLVLPRSPRVIDAVTGGQDTVAIRVPAHPAARRILGLLGQAQGRPAALAAPSANRYTELSPVRAMDVVRGLGPWLSEGDLVLDGGTCSVGLESTIVDLSGLPGRAPQVLRLGGLSQGQIASALVHGGGRALDLTLPTPGGPTGTIEAPEGSASAQDSLPRVAGADARHYAPRFVLRLSSAGKLLADAQALAAELAQQGVASPRIMVFGFHFFQEPLPVGIRQQMAPRTPEAYGRVLYAQMQDWQADGIDGVLAEWPSPSDGYGIDWAVVRDRLQRASASRMR